MNPLEIVRRTPRNNCGDCGHPTCLAFGAAVCAAGADPAGCPHIDLAGLEIQASAVGLEDGARQRDLALVEHLKGKIAATDLRALAPLIGAVPARGKEDISLRYLGQEVRVGRDGMSIDGQLPDDPRDQILLYNYLASGGGRGPVGEWLGLESLPNSISKVRTLAVYAESPLARLFDSTPKERLAGILSLAGGRETLADSASLALEFQVLPRVPQQVLFWAEEPEEGFDAKVKILYDQQVLDFLDIESLVFSSERLAERLTVLLDG